MEYVVTEWKPEWRGFWVDPSGYVDALGELAGRLPRRAREFATHAGHYDLASDKCVKDLALEKISIGDESSVHLWFDGNPWKHSQRLHISYSDVTWFLIKVSDENGSLKDIGTVLLDEILPFGAGCCHEIAMTGGSVKIRCRDLEAVWLDVTSEP